MISTNWNRFHWKTTVLPSSPKLKDPFKVRNATLEERQAVSKVALLAMTMNTEWHDSTSSAQEGIKEGVEKAFSANGEPSCLVISHGLRIVGVSMLDLNPEASCHLVTGPWVLTEYRNRGFGTALLWESLQKLAEHGIVDAFGMTQKNKTAARFIYPKFGGEIIPSALPEEEKVS